MRCVAAYGRSRCARPVNNAHPRSLEGRNSFPKPACSMEGCLDGWMLTKCGLTRKQVCNVTIAGRFCIIRERLCNDHHSFRLSAGRPSLVASGLRRQRQRRQRRQQQQIQQRHRSLLHVIIITLLVLLENSLTRQISTTPFSGITINITNYYYYYYYY